jgi:hypothetical protein
VYFLFNYWMLPFKNQLPFGWLFLIELKKQFSTIRH